MNFKDFFEMTFSSGKQDFSYNIDFSKANKVGNFNDYDILQYENSYGLSKNNQIYCWIIIKNNEIYGIRTIPEARREHLVENLLFWIKSYLNKGLFIGDTMSDDSIEFIKNIAKSARFKISWRNIKTGEAHMYKPEEDYNNLKPYRSLMGITDWRLYIESYEGDFFKKKYNEWNEMKVTIDLFA